MKQNWKKHWQLFKLVDNQNDVWMQKPSTSQIVMFDFQTFRLDDDVKLGGY